MSVSTLVDPADVAIIEQLEPEVQVFMDLIAKARPAVKRLQQAGYAGAGSVADELENILGDGNSVGELRNVVRSLQEFTVGAGDRAAYNYYRLVVQGGMTLRAACDELMEHCDDPTHDLDAVDALRRYAAKRQP